MKLFADDALLFRPIKSEKDCKSLQKDLNTLEIWSKRWKMTFNISKCHVLRMTGKKTTITQNYKLGNEPLTTVSSHPYLGVEFDSKLPWKVQVQNVKAKGTKTLNMDIGVKKLYQRHQCKHPRTNMPCPPNIGIRKRCLGPSPSKQNPDAGECSKQRGTVRNSGMEPIL